MNPPPTTEPQTSGQLEADIERQREQLARTIDALAAKLDVKAQARSKVADVRDRATDDAGRPRTEVLAGAVTAAVVLAGLVWWRRR